nr:MAG TPA: hypothetical protein [Caudoviricetes sp.]
MQFFVHVSTFLVLCCKSNEKSSISKILLVKIC